mmetsp:Transcript_32400/g.55441  ORF Transcript_32400/g.55441 Transcript_32400/m.55441 type:complete len:207 (+) Transcript_32400:87-707(+)
MSPSRSAASAVPARGELLGFAPLSATTSAGGPTTRLGSVVIVTARHHAAVLLLGVHHRLECGREVDAVVWVACVVGSVHVTLRDGGFAQSVVEDHRVQNVKHALEGVLNRRWRVLPVRPEDLHPLSRAVQVPLVRVWRLGRRRRPEIVMGGRCYRLRRRQRQLNLHRHPGGEPIRHCHLKEATPRGLDLQQVAGDQAVWHHHLQLL